MMCNKKIISIFFLISCMFFYFPKVASQSLNTPHYQFKKFTTDDGLSSNVINCVYKDSRGFLWIGTDRGPQRFNGSNFLSFRHLNADSTSISNEDIFAITEDRAHDIWFNSRDGVTKFNYQNNSFLIFTIHEQVSNHLDHRR